MEGFPQTLASVEFVSLNLKNLKILDGSWDKVSKTQNAKEEYLSEHIPGAIKFDMEEVRNKESSLPLMAPSKEQFEKFTLNLNIS